MISFRYRGAVKRLQLTQRIAEDKLSRMLNQLFNVKGAVLGFRAESGEYYDIESFCRQKAKFYGQAVDVMEANDQLEISCTSASNSVTSDNLSTSFVQPPPSQTLANNYIGSMEPQQQQRSTTSEISTRELKNVGSLGYVHDLRSVERVVVADPGSLSLVFVMEQLPYKTQLLVKLNHLANRHQEVTMFYHVLNSRGNRKFSVGAPLMLVFAGKKKVCQLALRNNFETMVETAVLKWSKVQEAEENQRAANTLDDDCPSFLTNNVLDRLSKETVDDYLQQMSQDGSINGQEYRKLCGMLDDRFAEFCRTYCRNLVDTDYESFRGEVLIQLHRTQLNDSNEEQDRPISRQEQRKSNLKKSVSDVGTVKVENYLEILESLSDVILEDELHAIKSLLIEENEQVMSYFAGFLSREYDKLTLANNLVIIAANSRTMARPISRCIPRNPRGQVRESPSGNEAKQASPEQPSRLPSKSDCKPQDEPRVQTNGKGLDLEVLQEKLLKMEEVPEFGVSRKPSVIIPPTKEIDSPCPSPEELSYLQRNLASGSFSPPRQSQQSLEQSYRNAEKQLLRRSDEFSPEEYGLWIHLLRTDDPSIAPLVQQLEANPTSSEIVPAIKKAMDTRLDSIFKAQFIPKEMEYFVREKQIEGSPIHCYFENFKFEADLETFLNELRKEIRKDPPKLLKKKSSLPSLKKIEGDIPQNEKANTNRSKGECSIQEESFDSKDSAQKQEENRAEELEAYYESPYWEKEFSEMLQCVDLSERTQQRLRRMMSEKSPQLFLILRQYILASQRNQPFGKNDIKKFIRRTERPMVCARLHKYTCFKYLLIALENEGKLTDAKARWLRTSFIDENFALIAAFESYLADKNEKELLDNMAIIMRMHSLRVQQTELDTFINRIIFFMGQIYEHPNMLNFAIHRYSKVFKGICEIYHMNADSTELFENLDLLNAYCFEKRVAEELARSFLNDDERKIIIEHFNRQVIPLIEGIIDTFESGRDFASFVMRYVKDWNESGRSKKLSAIEQIKSEEKLELDLPQRNKMAILALLQKNGSPHKLIQKVEQWDEKDPKLVSLWQLYEVTHSDEELIENLEILMLTPQEDELTNKFIDNLLESEQGPLTPALRFRLKEKQPRLMKILRQHSSGPTDSEGLKKSLEEYEREELPAIIKAILRSFGLSATEIERALTVESEKVHQAVRDYMVDNQKEETLLELLQRVVDEEDEPVEIEKPVQMPPESPIDEQAEITD